MPPYVCFLCASKGQHEVTTFYIWKGSMYLCRLKRFYTYVVLYCTWTLKWHSIFTKIKLLSFVFLLLVQMLFCQVCCEPFHRFCLEPAEQPSDENKENWCCRRCKFCHVCGRKNKHSKVWSNNLAVFALYNTSLVLCFALSSFELFSPSAIVGVWTMSELLSCFLPGTQLSQTKQEEESLGRLSVYFL